MPFSEVHEAALEGNPSGHPCPQLMTEHPLFKKAGHDHHDNEYRQQIPKHHDVDSQQNNREDVQLSCRMHYQQGDQQTNGGTWLATGGMSESSPVCGDMRDSLGDDIGRDGGRDDARGCEETMSWGRGTGEGLRRLHLVNDRPVHARWQVPACISNKRGTLVAAESSSQPNTGISQSHLLFPSLKCEIVDYFF